MYLLFLSQLNVVVSVSTRRVIENYTVKTSAAAAAAFHSNTHSTKRHAIPTWQCDQLHSYLGLPQLLHVMFLLSHLLINWHFTRT